ncbi:MAG: response regulator transcription factor [Oscillospiraceae bacterium]|nr:response regulator transcription factor [Oscillospiraceae bacterium]
MKKVLVIEDEAAIREFEVINLRRAGYEVLETGDGKSALEILENNNFDFDLAILDIMLPDVSGVELCRELRNKNETIGIILLTAKSQEMDKISGLMYGADDYITKPFSPSELLARVDALYRRVALNKTRSENNFKEEIKFGEFSINFKNFSLKKHGKIINLTQVEFQMMEYFFSNQGTILTREQILHRIWGEKYSDEKIVDVNIRRLRMKIENNPSRPKYIITVWKTGYKWIN